jgi:hypothetical protein
MEQLKTIGEVANAVNKPRHIVEYVVKSRGVAPAQRAGILRLFDSAGVEQIRQLLSTIQPRKMVAANV